MGIDGTDDKKWTKQKNSAFIQKVHPRNLLAADPKTYLDRNKYEPVKTVLTEHTPWDAFYGSICRKFMRQNEASIMFELKAGYNITVVANGVWNNPSPRVEEQIREGMKRKRRKEDA